MEIRPILSSLRKHRIPALLIVLEITLACAVLCNAVFMIAQRIHTMQLPNGIAESELSILHLQGADPANAAADIPRNIAALQAIPGVRGVTVTNTIPLSQNGWNSDFTATPSQRAGVNVAMYLMGRGASKALGLHLLEGRTFTDTEYAEGTLGKSFMPSGHVAMVTRSLAERMWPGQNALGKVLYADTFHFTVVGVVSDVLRPSRDGPGVGDFSYSTFFPLAPSQALSYYVVRSAPQDRDRVLREAEKTLNRLAPQAVVRGRSFDHIRNAYFADTRSMTWVLLLVCVVMLAVTAVGIIGLSSFWVQQRRAQIGIRRAVGARRSDILRYFQIENFLLVGVGVMLGMAVAWGINLGLMRYYELEPLPWFYLPVGALSLWLVGQLAVLGPALRAASIPPVEATRSV